jgi:integrase/recombinase XerD
MTGPATQPMVHWVDAYLSAAAAEQDAAANTLLAYARDLADFTGWLGTKGLHLATAMQGDVEAYLIRCEAAGLAKSTRARRLSAIRQLYRFAFDEGWRSDNPAIRLNGPARAASIRRCTSTTLSVPGSFCARPGPLRRIAGLSLRQPSSKAKR